VWEGYWKEKKRDKSLQFLYKIMEGEILFQIKMKSAEFGNLKRKTGKNLLKRKKNLGGGRK